MSVAVAILTSTAIISGAWSAIDGSLGAVVGTPQYPTDLQTYAAPPPFKVPGVHYRIAEHSAPALDPASAPAGTSYNAGTHMLTITANNVTLDGYDFSLHGGIGLFCSSSFGNLIIRNCKWGGVNLPNISAVAIIDFRGHDLTFEYNTVDGGAAGGSPTCGALLSVGFGGTIGVNTIRYNWFKNSTSDCIDAAGDGSLIVKYNLIDDNPSMETSAHMDYVQLSSGVLTLDIEFNYTRQVSTPTAAGEGFQAYFNGTGTLVNPKIKYNTMVARGGTPVRMSHMNHGSDTSGTTTISGIAEVSYNYIDATNAFAGFYPNSFTSWTKTGNIDMTTGSTITPT